MHIDIFKKDILDEGKAFAKIQEIRGYYEILPKGLKGSVPKEVSKDPAGEAVRMIKKIHLALNDFGVDLQTIEAGHGVGRMKRDYANSLLLLPKLNLSPGELFVGLVASNFHHIGLTIVPRYEEAKRAVRHAEASALILQEVMDKCIDIDELLYSGILYSVAAHTHYLTPADVACADGVTRTVRPYADLDADGNPAMFVFATRWVDRLECCGPSFLGRHYLTLSQPPHIDYSQSGFYQVNYPEHMLPVIRSPEEIKAAGGNRTMLEHANMFATSQHNGTPYGKHDYGAMVEMRDEQANALKAVIQAVQADGPNLTREEDKILNCWTLHLGKTIEPTQLGQEAAGRLEEMFENLESSQPRQWLHGFKVAIEKYNEWSLRTQKLLMKLPADYMSIPVLTNSLEEEIKIDEIVGANLSLC